MLQLAGLFALTALLYAMVGFGGGSTYNALLVLSGTDYRLLPAIALLSNIIVVSGGSWRFWRAGHVRFDRLWPWFLLSIPAAWLGGRIAISETVFIGLLGGALLIAGLQLAFERHAGAEATEGRALPLPLQAGIGGGIGLLSGLVGIGGGIFLAPILYLLRWGPAREIAGTASVFILVNSLAGLTGQLMKLDDFGQVEALQDYWLLFPAVLIGGQIGSRIGSTRLPPLLVKRMTAVLILYVAARLLWRWWTALAA
ncbi:sulfite exporter TauE/SafE family protein [uncultured Parasphingopyxis sp.]|uniref:sulfite exporter TauE/SafE family protein n=1 Tax=uncultured Parasphingopyxis sp. TaxID=1547918 RepID=UPI0026053475|nr:sulfite exporter TauE/SafE family protein [uncultured Parasphingopyxis sp.]